MYRFYRKSNMNSGFILSKSLLLPGILFILSGITILIFPEILIALFAATLLVIGGIMVIFALQLRSNEKKAQSTIKYFYF